MKKIIVIKIGGSILDHKDARKQFYKDLKHMIKLGYWPIIVHGGGKQATSWLTKAGIATRFVKGLRYTDKDTLEIVEMVFSGTVNKMLVSEINRISLKACGLSGRDGMFIKARQVKELGFVGKVQKVDFDFLKIFVKNGLIPVVSSIAVSSKGGALNVNADEIADALASSMKAERLIFMSDIPGVLKDINHSKSLIQTIQVKNIKGLIDDNIIQGGMIPKIKSAALSILNGVKEVDIVDGRHKGVLKSCFSNKKTFGTRIKK
ncbi:acetylglutamate kinase [bacterium]